MMKDSRAEFAVANASLAPNGPGDDVFSFGCLSHHLTQQSILSVKTISELDFPTSVRATFEVLLEFNGQSLLAEETATKPSKRTWLECTWQRGSRHLQWL